MKNFSKQEIELAVKSTKSATQAAKFLNVKYDTFKKYALKYSLFKTNQAGKGVIKKKCSYKDLKRLKNIKRRLINTGLKEEICEICGLGKYWMNKLITLELHHINGDKKDNSLSNLQMLCPNCHSQTHNYRNKKSALSEKREVEFRKFDEGLTANIEPSSLEKV